ncbi:hypothetical protein QJS04_geneDACA013147 [Acorus gramineus]|uniref:Uncharacterized protein n=1 Tax=Acorus gramineus TaxID=55184 RepID=A0AAV9BDH5_ACOGR|nr:hypothetical protein QJS04_geneDACA013147 [Acorus gramineus]
MARVHFSGSGSITTGFTSASASYEADLLVEEMIDQLLDLQLEQKTIQKVENKLLQKSDLTLVKVADRLDRGDNDLNSAGRSRLCPGGRLVPVYDRSAPMSIRNMSLLKATE